MRSLIILLQSNRTRSIQGMKRKYGKEGGDGKNEGEEEEKKVEEDDDRQYYRDAVGEEPDAGERTILLQNETRHTILFTCY